MATVAFVGLGRMGFGMANRLLDTGFSLRVFNRTGEKAGPLKDRGATVCSGPAEAAAGAQVLVTMLADDEAVREVAYGDRGFVAALPAGAVHVSMSTISPDMSRELAGRHREHGSELVSAPVMGRPEAAASGALWILAAGPRSLEQTCAPLFGALGRGHTWLDDDPGAANVAKLALNFFLLASVEALAEAFTLVEKAGVDRACFFEPLMKFFGTPALEGYGRRMLGADFVPAGFTTRLALKDIGLALSVGHAAAAPLPIASVVRDRLLAGAARGRADWDLSALLEVARDDAGMG